MSLLRLLSAGKSLVGLQAPTSRYRLSKHRMLPEFGGKKEPFRGTVRPASLSDTAPCVQGSQENATVSMAITPPNVQAVVENRPSNAAMPAAVRAEPGIEVKPHVDSENSIRAAPSGFGDDFRRSAAWGKGVARVAGGLRKARSLAPRVQGSGSQGIRMIPRLRPLVQGELSLDKIKVVRNDLSDTDLEIVSAGRHKAGGGNPFARKEKAPAAAQQEISLTSAGVQANSNR